MCEGVSVWCEVCVWSSSYLFWFEGGQLDLSEENMRRVIVSGDIEPSRLGLSLAVGRGGREE